MSKVGIVTNPASGRDIRRLVAQAWVVSNQEKSAITARLLRGLEAAGVEQVLYMPEPAGICPKACQKMGSTKLRLCPVQIPVTCDPQDSTRAAAAMVLIFVSVLKMKMIRKGKEIEKERKLKRKGN